jgi:thiamine-monophosphate kinase
MEQNKYKISLCGGDTTFSNQLSFSITSIGYSKNIIIEIKLKLMMIYM